MESITKNRQSTEVLRAMIERAYGPDLVPDGADFAEEMGHGWFNVAYRLRLRDGRHVVAKIAPPPHVTVMTYEHEMMRNELAAMAIVERETDVPIPHVEYADTSRTLVDADWFVMEYVDAENLGIVSADLPPEQVADLTRQLGRVNRDLNAVVGPHFGPLRGPGYASWRAAFGQMLEDALIDGERAGVDLGWEYGQVRAAIARRAHALDDVTEPRFVEWDLWDSNVMIRDGRIVSIIDHERALYGDPLIEAGFTGFDVPVVGDPGPFISGYGRGELTGLEVDRRWLYSLYLLLIMTIETRYRGHTDTQQYDWARAQLAALRATEAAAPRAANGDATSDAIKETAHA